MNLGVDVENKANNLTESNRVLSKIPMSACLGQCLRDFIEEDPRVMALDSDVGLEKLITPEFIKKHQGRIINVGISEANMIGIACGLSLKGKIPFTHTFGCFAARRVLDQVYISGAFGGANVKMIGSMPGITATINGGTHMSFEDVAVMRTIPGMVVVEPSDNIQGEEILKIAKNQTGMFYIRWERKGRSKFYKNDSVFKLGRAVTLREGCDVTIISLGNLCLEESFKATEILLERGIKARLLDMFTVKPIDKKSIVSAVRETGCLVTVENHNVIGGLASAVSEVMAETESAPLEKIGINDSFGVVGDLDSLKEYYGLTASNIVDAAMKAILRKENRGR